MNSQILRNLCHKRISDETDKTRQPFVVTEVWDQVEHIGDPDRMVARVLANPQYEYHGLPKFSERGEYRMTLQAHAEADRTLSSTTLYQGPNGRVSVNSLYIPGPRRTYIYHRP